MNLTKLIELSKEASGSYGELAKKLGVAQARITNWKTGERQPTTGQIGLMAEVAGLPAIETIAAIESSLNSDFAGLWERILGKMKAAGVSAAVVLSTIALVICSMATPKEALAETGGNGR